MAVYTHLGAEELAHLIAQYDVGDLVSAKGIAEGVSNSNWLVDTTGVDGRGARFILTLYERRIQTADLPYFLDLTDRAWCAEPGTPWPIGDRAGRGSKADQPFGSVVHTTSK
jgi:homoserine kinase type II